MQLPSQVLAAVHALPVGSTGAMPPSEVVLGTHAPPRQVVPPWHCMHIWPAVPQAKLFSWLPETQRPKAQQPDAHETASQVVVPASTVPPVHVPLLHCEPPGHIAHWPPPVPHEKRDC